MMNNTPPPPTTKKVWVGKVKAYTYEI